MRSKPQCKIVTKKNVTVAFIKGLIKDTHMHIELTMRKPKTFSDLFDKVKGWIAYEDDLKKRNKRDFKREERKNTSK